MLKREIWTVLFCSDCHEPVVPSQITRYGSAHLCPECETDLLNNPEKFDQPVLS